MLALKQPLSGPPGDEVLVGDSPDQAEMTWLHQRLRARMSETRACAVPVLVVGGRLLDGLHRARLAAELGLPVTDDPARADRPGRSSSRAVAGATTGPWPGGSSPPRR